VRQDGHRSIGAWRELAKARRGDRAQTRDELVASLGAGDPAWIYRLGAREIDAQMAKLDEAAAARGVAADDLPLYGVPFAVKDNIDVAGLPTSAACPDFAYVARESAPVVERLMRAGAILAGKTNLDQFATGLVGTRSPYGAVPNSFRPEYISGGSSSGSASVVARGIVAFSLGTDTAGSGRVPAGFNNIVGLKPTRGALSARGVIPACRSLDCVSIFALTLDDARAVYELASGYDELDPYSRRASTAKARKADSIRFAYPRRPEFFGDALAQAAFDESLERLRSLGIELEPFDFTPLHEVAELLYHGPWVAERYAALEAFATAHPSSLEPSVGKIILDAGRYSASDYFKAEYRRRELLGSIAGIFDRYDALAVPTSPTIYKTEEVLADPIELNTRLGLYTNFVNLADMSALAFPGALRSDGLPAGITLIGPAWDESRLIDLAQAYYRRFPWKLGNGERLETAGAPSAGAEDPVVLAVAGAHLSGLPLNRELTERGARFVERTKTSACYRLYRLAGSFPPKPGLIRREDGRAQEVELWELGASAFGEFVAAIRPPLGVGKVELEDGRWASGFLCEGWAVEGAEDISEFGGWRAYLAASAHGK
jgi:allophanate hydrolase